MKAIVNSVKHIAQGSLTTIDSGNILNVTIAKTVNAEPINPTDVVVGSVIKAVFIEYWLLGSSAQPVVTTWTLEKVPNDGTPMTFLQNQELDKYSNKRNILKLGQGIVGDSNSNPIPVVREWVKIPKGKQRFAQGDALYFNVSSLGEAQNDLEICGVSVYKEYQ